MFFDVDTHRLLCRERVERLTRDARGAPTSRKRRAGQLSVTRLPRPLARSRATRPA